MSEENTANNDANLLLQSYNSTSSDGSPQLDDANRADDDDGDREEEAMSSSLTLPIKKDAKDEQVPTVDIDSNPIENREQQSVEKAVRKRRVSRRPVRRRRSSHSVSSDSHRRRSRSSPSTRHRRNRRRSRSRKRSKSPRRRQRSRSRLNKRNRRNQRGRCYRSPSWRRRRRSNSSASRSKRYRGRRQRKSRDDSSCSGTGPVVSRCNAPKRSFREEMRDQVRQSGSLTGTAVGSSLKVCTTADGRVDTDLMIKLQQEHIKRTEEAAKSIELKTGVQMPKFYNPASLNPVKFAEQQQKRKLLWSKKDEKLTESKAALWNTTSLLASGGDNEAAAKFRKLIGLGESASCSSASMDPDAMSEEQRAWFSRLDKEYETARVLTHTHKGMGLGYGCQPALIDPNLAVHQHQHIHQQSYNDKNSER